MPKNHFLFIHLAGAAAILMAGLAHAAPDQASGSGRIYTCVDSLGRRLTSDRPIAECNDREQRELLPSGVTRRVIKPTPTASEMKNREISAHEQEKKRQQEENARQRDMALAIRYPNQAEHDKARREALELPAMRLALIEKYLKQLDEERSALQKKLDGFANPDKAPVYLKRNLETANQNFEAQQRAFNAVQDERKKINAEFDEELARLQAIWAAQKK